MATIFSPRDETSWRARSLPPSALPEGHEEVAPEAIFEQVRKALSDDALSLEAARQLAADAIACFLRTAQEEEAAHVAVTSLQSSEDQAQGAASSRARLQTIMERLDAAIGLLLGEVLTSAQDREDQASRQELHRAASDRVKAAAKGMRTAEAAFVAALAECRAAHADAKEANRTLPRGGSRIKIPDELKGEVILSVEQVEKWSHQDAKGRVMAFEDRDVVAQGGKSVATVHGVGFVRRAMFDQVTFRKLGDEEASIRHVHRPDLKTQRVLEAEAEDPGRPTLNQEAILEALNQGTMTFIENGKRTVRRV